MVGSDPRLVRVRVTAKHESIEALAGKIVSLLEQEHEVVEWSRPYPCREPDMDMSRVYLAAIRKGENE